MPLKVTTVDLRGAGVIGPNDVPSFDTMSVHAFEALTAIEKAIFDERTGVNRLKDEKLKTAKQLGETLPLEEPGQERPDWQAVTREATQAETDAGTDDARIVTPLKLANYSGRAKRFAANVGDGSATSITVTHNLNTRDVQVQVYRNSGNYDQVLVETRYTSVNSVTLVFDSAPAANAFRCVVMA